MVNYQEAKIYKIINDEMEGLVYYGSTCNTFAKRMNGHKSKSNPCSSNVLFQYGNPQIILVEKYPCNDKMELKQRERYYIENNACVNKNIPNRNHKEWRKDNKEHIKEYGKEWQKINVEKVKSYYQDKKEQYYLLRSQKISCECGRYIRYGDKARHFKTKKHNAFISSN